MFIETKEDLFSFILLILCVFVLPILCIVYYLYEKEKEKMKIEKEKIEKEKIEKEKEKQYNDTLERKIQNTKNPVPKNLYYIENKYTKLIYNGAFKRECQTPIKIEREYIFEVSNYIDYEDIDDYGNIVNKDTLYLLDIDTNKSNIELYNNVYQIKPKIIKNKSL